MCCVGCKASTWLIWSIVSKLCKSTIISSTSLHTKSMSEITLSYWTLNCTEKLTLESSSSFSQISTHTHPLSDSINFITGIFLAYKGLMKWIKSSCLKILDWSIHFQKWIFSNTQLIENLHLFSLKLNNFIERLFQRFLMLFHLTTKLSIIFLLRRMVSLLSLLAMLEKILFLEQRFNAHLNNQGCIN